MKYFIAIGDKKEGPFELKQLKKLMFDPETMVWKEGMKEWIEISQLEELNQNIKIPELQTEPLSPPPLPIQATIPPNDRDNKFLTLKQKDFKRQVAKSKYNERKEELIKSFKSNLYIFLITVPLSIGTYFLTAYFEGGFEAINLKQQYEPYLNSKLDRATVDYDNYDKVPLEFKKQLKIESQIEDLMNDHKRENELSPTSYENLAKFHDTLNKTSPDLNNYSFVDGTVALDYSTFLDDRIQIAFKEIAILITLTFFIFSSILFFSLQFYRQRKLK